MISGLVLNSNQNWEQIYSETREAIPAVPNGYIPIPAFEVPILLESPLIAIRVSSPKAKSHWRSAGYIFQKIALGAGGAVSPLPDAISQAVFVRPNRVTLCSWAIWQTPYQLIYEIPFWFEEATVQIWQYKGPVSPSIDSRLADIEVTLEAIELVLTNP